MTDFDIIVIGAGHAGCEAARAAARMGQTVGLCLLDESSVAHMPCNPAVGGTAKGHLVREIDALGGLMGEAIDATGIQFKLLNRSRGPAVWSPRAQADKHRYSNWVRDALKREKGISWIRGRVDSVLVKDSKINGVSLSTGACYYCKALVVTTGTFLNGVIHIGPEQHAAGRVGEPPARALAESLKALNFRWGRLKTGTPPRVHRSSIDFTQLSIERGDQDPVPFSFMTNSLKGNQIDCYLAHTNERVHSLVRQNLNKSPLFNGQIQGIGPRYCPSLEDKIVRFPEKDRHQIFLEPEGIDVDEVYINGFSMSLPREVQAAIVRSMPGLEQAEIIRPGYAVEYDFIQPTELRQTLESQRISGLYFAGQVNGTSGYEEAAGQGLLAGINAALKVASQPPFILSRSEAYIGVMIDDLTTTGCLEPYRMFTSRAEHRLLMRIDNADLRLTSRGREIGLVSNTRWSTFKARQQRYEKNLQVLKKTTVTLTGGRRVRASRALKQPSIHVAQFVRDGQVDLDIEEKAKHIDLISVETEFKYEGYLKRQAQQVEKSKRNEKQRIPDNVDFASLPGLSLEVVERLTRVRPETLGQASRIPGVTPAAVSIILAFVCSGRHYDRKMDTKAQVI
ncbi:MAG TPA: tRNA uridine-5-carboxymethylaminomethyl(34) synthesis enzyme MnmG [Acidobacteria bacterium]|jgi:tRNA uridine 5-carboxymethylaminomethyl modification enzyme|nr:tRNA uridine-5-carboxymethylaminomethyl(34) synthesis enzyme MnmG [Acidobacteriota bacterium]